jgi:hypothetical protein
MMLFFFFDEQWCSFSFFRLKDVKFGCKFPLLIQFELIFTLESCSWKQKIFEFLLRRARGHVSLVFRRFDDFNVDFCCLLRSEPDFNALFFVVCVWMCMYACKHSTILPREPTCYTKAALDPKIGELHACKGTCARGLSKTTQQESY